MNVEHEWYSYDVHNGQSGSYKWCCRKCHTVWFNYTPGATPLLGMRLNGLTCGEIVTNGVLNE